MAPTGNVTEATPVTIKPPCGEGVCAAALTPATRGACPAATPGLKEGCTAPVRVPPSRLGAPVRACVRVCEARRGVKVVRAASYLY